MLAILNCPMFGIWDGAKGKSDSFTNQNRCG
jgi:hypothetical protein